MKRGSQVLTTGRIRPRSRPEVPSCADCGRPVDRCVCVDDTPPSVAAQMSVRSLLVQLRGAEP